MVSALASVAVLAYNSAAISSAAAKTTGTANTAATGTTATPVPTDTITLSPNAQRLQSAINNLTTLENSGSNLAGVWNKDYAQGWVDSDQESSADTEISALPTSDPDHISQAGAAQSYVKQHIASGLSGNFGKPINTPNPFSGASTQSLVAIISDKSGLYTKYEKAAAGYEYQDQQNAWIGSFDLTHGGPTVMAGYYSKALSVYNNLPTLVKVSYAPDYVATTTKQQQFYASGHDDNDLPSFFGKSDTGTPNDPKNLALKLLKGLVHSGDARHASTQAKIS